MNQRNYEEALDFLKNVPIFDYLTFSEKLNLVENLIEIKFKPN